MINKPITVAYEDLKKNIVTIVNESGVPAFVVELLLKDVLSEIRDIARTQYETDNENYQNALNNEDLQKMAPEDVEVVS